jgi:hypothetical protein
VSRAVAQGAAEGTVPERGSVQESVPERRSADEPPPEGDPARPAPAPAASAGHPLPGGSPAGHTLPGGSPAGHTLHGGIGGVADRFRDDDGSADPAAAAALSAFAAGAGSEHAALLALAATRLLVPLVAEVAPDAASPRTAPPSSRLAPSSAEPALSSSRLAPPFSGAAASVVPSGPGAGEKTSDMALPTLVGRDGRRAIPAFTSVAALARWQRAARPLPADAAQVWRAAIEDSCAVIIDVAGPVPLAVEGARLAALAQAVPVPALHEDPDVQAVVEVVITEALARLPSPGAPAPGAAAPGAAATGALVGFALHPGADGGDLVIELAVAPMIDAESLAAQVGSAVMQRLGSRLRRGVALALSPMPGRLG